MKLKYFAINQKQNEKIAQVMIEHKNSKNLMLAKYF